MTQIRWLTQDEQRTWRSFLGATQSLFERLDRQLAQDSVRSLLFDALTPEQAKQLGEISEAVLARTRDRGADAELDDAELDDTDHT